MRSRPDEIDLTGLWMVPYADLMTTLVILFLSLFAVSYIARAPEYDRAVSQMEEDLASKKEARLARARTQEAELAVSIKNAMQRLALKDFGIRVTAKYVHLVLPAPVLFAEGSDRLNPDSARILKPLSDLFAGVPNPILVAGHTDDRPIAGGRHKTNWELSAARSFSVIEFFIRRGLDPGRFHARGYGEYRPAAPNASPEGRRLNRRIEISLIRELRKEG